MKKEDVISVELMSRLMETMPNYDIDRPYEVIEGAEAFVLMFADEVIRFHRQPLENRIKAERFFASKFLNEKDLCVAEVSFYDPKNEMSVQPRIKGQVLVPETLESSANTIKISQLNSTQIENISKNLARFFSKMHGSVTEELKRNSELGFLRDSKEQWTKTTCLSLISEHLERHPSMASKIEKFLNSMKEAPLLSSSQVLVHGDLGYGNVLFDLNTDTLGIIDFGQAGLSCIEEDFIQLAYISPQIFQQTIKTYNHLTNSQIDPNSVLMLAAAKDIKLSGKLKTNEVEEFLTRRLGNLADNYNTLNAHTPEGPKAAGRRANIL